MLEHEELYDVLINGEGELLFSIKIRDNEPKSPKLLYDGGEHALLYRTTPSINQENGQKVIPQMILLDYLHEDIKPTLDKAQKILVLEANQEEQMIMRVYSVPVMRVSKLPISENDLPTIE